MQAAAIAAGGGVASSLLGSITSGINNTNNNNTRLELQAKDFEFRKNYLGYQNDARLDFLSRLSDAYSKMGLPPMLAYGPMTPYNSTIYRTGLSYSAPQQAGFNGSAMLGYATPANFV